MSLINDLENGEVAILLADLRDESFVPRKGGRKFDKSVPFRWASRGISGHRLETLKTPRGAITTKAAVLRFFAALSGNGPISAPTQRQRARQVAKADSELAAAGI